VLTTPALLEHADLVHECLREAPEVALEPFLAVLDEGPPDATRLAAVLGFSAGAVTLGFTKHLAAAGEDSSDHSKIRVPIFEERRCHFLFPAGTRPASPDPLTRRFSSLHESKRVT
jgi:hypothetical protein